nr:uncharacterized protein At2g38710-like [Lolium perenne]
MRHGIAVILDYKATPSLHQQGWTILKTIDSLTRKAGYNGTITESLRSKIRVTRYQSTLYTMHYGEYAASVKNRDEINMAPVVNGSK